MKRSRSLIVLMTVAVLLFAFAGLAVAAEQDDAAERLEGFGVIEGYPDGTMGLEREITRAEFAKIAVVAKGLEEAADLLQANPSQFSDVQTNVWYTGWVNVANAQGIVKGDPVGTFRPNDNISVAEAVAMILRTLGYNDNLPGAWPTNYLVKGADLGVTTGIVTNANANALRGDVFTMLNRALDEDVVVWGSTTKDADADFSPRGGDNPYTLLQEMLNAKEETEGRVVNNTWTRSSLKANELEVNVYDEDGNPTNKVTKFKLQSGEDVNYLLGLEVTLKHNTDDEVLYVDIDTDADDIVFDQIESGYNVVTNELELKAEDDDFDIDEDAEFVIFDNEKVRKVTGDRDDEFDLDITEFNYGKFVFESGDIVFAVVFNFNESEFAGLVTEVKDDFIEYLAYEDDEYDIDIEAYDEIYVFDTDFKLIDIEEVDENSVIYAWENDDDELYLIVANSDVDGEMTSAREDRVTVDGNNIKVTGDYTTISDNDNNDVYYYSGTNGRDALENLVDEDVIVFVDAIGFARHIIGDSEGTSGDQYGLALRSYETSQSIRILTQDGTTVTYEFEEEDDFDHFSDHFGFRGTEGNFVPVEYQLNRDGEIKEESVKVIAAGTEYNAFTDIIPSNVSNLTSIAEFDDEDDYIRSGNSRYYISNNTVIMTFEDRDDEDVVEWDNIKSKNPGTGVKAFVLGSAGRTADFVVFYENFTDVVDDTLYAVAPNRAEYKSGDWTMKLDVAGEGEQEYILDRERDVARHSLVKFTVDSDNVVKTTTASDFVQIVKADFEDARYKVTDVDGNDVELMDASGDTAWYRLDSGAVIWETKADGNTDRKISRVRANDWIVFVGDNTLIKAALQINKYVNAEDFEDYPVDGPVLADLTAYNAVLNAVDEDDYTPASWAAYQEVVDANVVTNRNTQAEVDAAKDAIEAAQGDLVLLPEGNILTGEIEPALAGDTVLVDVEDASKVEKVTLNGVTLNTENWGYGFDGNTVRIPIEETNSTIVITMDGEEYTVVIR